MQIVLESTEKAENSQEMAPPTPVAKNKRTVMFDINELQEANGPVVTVSHRPQPVERPKLTAAPRRPQPVEEAPAARNQRSMMVMFPIMVAIVALSTFAGGMLIKFF